MIIKIAEDTVYLYKMLVGSVINGSSHSLRNVKQISQTPSSTIISPHQNPMIVRNIQQLPISLLIISLTSVSEDRVVGRIFETGRFESILRLYEQCHSDCGAADSASFHDPK
jgi:hypothetical protein